MTTICLTTEIPASIETCFDLSRSIDVHLISTWETHEKAIAGKTSGLLNEGEEVTWKANHFGVWLTMTIRMAEMKRPYMFTDVMVNGPFKSISHMHTFKQSNEKTLMIDRFEYETPFGPFGNLFDKLCLKAHLTSLLMKRNALIKKLSSQKDKDLFLMSPDP